MSETGPDPERTREVPEAPPLDRSTVDRWGAPRADARMQRSSFVGMAGMAMVLFLILASGTVMPWWAMAALALVWLVGLVRAAQWFMSHPRRVVAIPVGLAALWLAVLMGGAFGLGWGR
jgi:hypothetical protein